MTSKVLVEASWSKQAEDVVQEAGVQPEEGLSHSEVAARQKTYGKNALRKAQTRSVWAILIDQFTSLIIALLAVAAVLSFAFGDVVEGTAVVAVIVINTAIGFFTELKAVRSMESLRKLSRVDAVVRREGGLRTIPAAEIVPGDVMIFGGGDVVTADVRLIQASRLQADESALTGESVPVEKSTGPIDAQAALAERANMLFKGTAVARGSGEGVVVGTGMETELGQISELVESAEEEVTPLEKRLDALGRKLIWVTLGLTGIIALTGVFRGEQAVLMIKTAVALAVAAIPEGLPIVATIALARGMMRMARRNALINKLASVETLGATSVICTDKTGTLTVNRMTVGSVRLAESEVSLDRADQSPDHDGAWAEGSPAREALVVGVLCNNASLAGEDEGNGDGIGDPLEVALLKAGAKIGVERDELLDSLPEEREEAFDSETKMMATFHRQQDGYYVAIKGAPEPVIANCARVLAANGEQDLADEERQRWVDTNEAMAARGLRVLAVAKRRVDDVGARPYEDMTLIGLLGLWDPPRDDVRDAIDLCHHAGIRLIMVTGDQPRTAQNIAASIGFTPDREPRVLVGRELKNYDELTDDEKADIVGVSIFARVSPRQKLDIIALHQQNRSVVAMTGDGVNDAPALKKADIGIAMGQRGTQVAQEAADMILQDDAFATIVAAVQQGRIIFRNIRLFVLYLLSCNASEIIAVGGSSLANVLLPLLPLQILFLNLVTDVFPALALGVGEGDRNVMDRPPRSSSESIIERTHWMQIGAYGVLIAACVVGALLIATSVLGLKGTDAVTISFLTLAFAQLWHVLNMRAANSKLLVNEVTRNKFVWLALLLCVALILIVLYVPFLAGVINLSPPDLAGWGVVVGMSLVPLVIGQVGKMVARDE